MDPLKLISTIASSGMRAQSERLQVVSENVANAYSTSQTPGGEPYARKSVSFEAAKVGDVDAAIVQIGDIELHDGSFKLRYEPTHPAADENGYVKMPDVNPLIEMSNMREAARSYEANLSMMENAREMRRLLVDLLR